MSGARGACLGVVELEPAQDLAWSSDLFPGPSLAMV